MVVKRESQTIESSRCGDRLAEDSRLAAILVDGCRCEELADVFLFLQVGDDSRRDDLCRRIAFNRVARSSSSIHWFVRSFYDVTLTSIAIALGGKFKPILDFLLDHVVHYL